MRISESWKDYELIDCSCGERLERWGNITLIRPDPQVIWQTERAHPLWGKANARYLRSSSGGGRWEVYGGLPDVWQIGYRALRFNIKTMGFKHTGLFPEQAVNWDLVRHVIRSAGRPVQMLNLFAYTGGATLACLEAGAEVVHVDASRGMVAWAKENAAASGLAGRPVRWMVADCGTFVEREIRRGPRYELLIRAPPSYGRGPSGEIWKLEDKIYSFVELCTGVLSEDALMVLVNSYTTGLSPAVMQYILGAVVKSRFGGAVSSDEIGLPASASQMALPCGATAVWRGPACLE